jgi:hypothetical protein
MNGSVWSPRNLKGGGSPVTKLVMSTLWAADRLRPTVLSPCGIATAPAPISIPDPVRYASLGRTRLGGLELRVEQHVFAMFPAIQMNAQVKGASKRTSLGPHPWRPPE